MNLFKKKETMLTESQLKWNKMWDLWSDGKTKSPYTELMTYQSEINNGGHAQYFSNVDDPKREISELMNILSATLIENLLKAYETYLTTKDSEEDEKADEIIKKCDFIFYENEQEINQILENYAETIEI